MPITCARCGNRTVRPKRVRTRDGFILVCQSCASKLGEAKEQIQVGPEIAVQHPGPKTTAEQLEEMKTEILRIEERMAWIRGQLVAILQQQGRPVPDWLRAFEAKGRFRSR